LRESENDLLKPTPQNAVVFARQNNVICQGTKVSRVSLFNIIRNKELLAYRGEEYLVWPKFTVLSRKLRHEQTTAL